jgi:hypothetical protein
MGEGQEAGEESGGIVWQSKSYRKTVHWKCNLAKEKQPYTSEKGGPQGNLLGRATRR